MVALLLALLIGKGKSPSTGGRLLYTCSLGHVAKQGGGVGSIPVPQICLQEGGRVMLPGRLAQSGVTCHDMRTKCRVYCTHRPICSCALVHSGRQQHTHKLCSDGRSGWRHQAAGRVPSTAVSRKWLRCAGRQEEAVTGQSFGACHPQMMHLHTACAAQKAQLPALHKEAGAADPCNPEINCTRALTAPQSPARAAAPAESQ